MTDADKKSDDTDTKIETAEVIETEAVELTEPEAEDRPQGDDPVSDELTVEPAPEQTAEPLREPAEKRSGFLPMVLGGAVAAGLGFGASQYVGPLLSPSGQPDFSASLAAQEAGLAKLQAGLDELRAMQTQSAADQAAAAATTDAATAMIEEKIAGATQALSVEVSGLSSGLASLGERLSAVEKRPVEGGGVSDTALAAYEREMQALRDLLEDQRQKNEAMAGDIESVAAAARAQIAEAEAQAAALKTEAEETARRATSRAALSRVQAALESGGDFSAALADLTNSGAEVPQTLLDSAAAGVPTLVDLQNQFPAAARDALAASVTATMGDGITDRVMAFLRSQTGARSLSPREGDDPDAVLSRAEAALRAGQLDIAMTELAALPEAGRNVMADWVAQAQRRQDTVTAVQALSGTLNTN